jgi:NOL1/NOP2/fmu family ribosome biogenesis protein
MVDAPCSGEGMFKKNDEAAGEWSLDNVKLCAKRQFDILSCAAAMLRPGGRLVYSTCTFAQEENEGTISRFIREYPEFSVSEVKKYEGMVPGMADGMENTIRLFPHKLRGEGHFVAVLKKAGSVPEGYSGFCANGTEKGIKPRDVKEFTDFCEEFLSTDLLEESGASGHILLRFGDQLYLAPPETPSLKNIKVLRPGLHLGTIKKNRFEPSHALALALSREDVCNTLDLGGDSAEARAYLGGQTLQAEGGKGWYLITVDGYSLGWGKLASGIMKNHYPKGLRIY